MKKNIVGIILCTLLITTVASFSVSAFELDTDRESITNNMIRLNSPPDAPTIIAPEQVGRGRTFSVQTVTTDPDGDDVYYRYELWGNKDTWKGPFQSGAEHDQKFKFIVPPGTYVLGAQAKDIHGAESDWTYTEITVTKSKSIASPLMNILQNHPQLFPILRFLLRL